MASKSKKIFKETERSKIEKIFEAHGSPGWLGWGTYGAESSFGKASNDEGFGFGLIEPEYPNTRLKRPIAGSVYHNAELSAEIYEGYYKEGDSLPKAVAKYTGNSYGISHLHELGGNKGSSFKEQHPGINEALGEPGIGGELGINIGNPLDALIGIGEVFKVIGELLFTPEGWLRIGKIVGGALFFVWGLEKIMAGSSPSKGPVSSLAKDAAVAAVVK